MKINVFLVKFILGAGVLASSVSGFAADSKAAPKNTLLKETSKSGETLKGLKLAYVDLQSAILQTEEGKTARSAIEKEAQKRRDALVAQEKELKTMNDEFQAQASVLSDAAKADKQKDFQKKLEAFQTARMGFEQEFGDKEKAETGKILQKMSVIVEELSKKNGFDLVFERSAGSLLYAAKIEDITKDVVSEYNKRHTVKK